MAGATRETWAVVLAGGDGTRLRSLTTRIAGAPCPKQYCPIFDGETLLDRTRGRARLLVPEERQVVVVTRAHAPYYAALERALPAGRLVVQPDNRGTAAGILYPLLRVRHLAGDATAVVMPSDHHVSDDRAFMDSVRAAADLIDARPNVVALLGIEPDAPEVEYGWIEPVATSVGLHGSSAFAVRRFWEKPATPVARKLFAGGALWNSFVIVGTVSTFLALFAAATPELLRAFEPLARALGSRREARTADRVYARLRPVDFSGRVLERVTERLVVVRVRDVSWSDWGRPERVLASLSRAGERPAWLRDIRRTATA